MLTKEECKFALQRLYSLKNGVRNLYPMADTETLLDSITNDRELLEQLIDEHFDLLEKHNNLKADYHFLDSSYSEAIDHLNDFIKMVEDLESNPPLRFEELKEGMWVWDNKEKMYGKVTPKEYKNFGLLQIVGYSWGNFEENRFYRREVEK